MKVSLIACLAIISICATTEKVIAFYYGDTGKPNCNEVHIGKTAIVMPSGRILIVRHDTRYCAIKFTKFWTGNTKDDFYANYESYCQEDNSSDFSKNNVLLNKEKLSFPTPRGIGRFSFSLGNKEINCGSIKLFWSGDGAVHFYGLNQKQGDYGIELAPTPWTDISQVNVSDPRVKWYRYDDGRRRENIPIDELWPEAGPPAKSDQAKP